MSRSLLDAAFDARAQELGVQACHCEEPDVVWVEAKQDWDWSHCRTCGGAVVQLSGAEVDAIYEARGWKREPCGVCGGHGVRWVGEGVDDCRYCAGGTVWRTPRGRYALWPGGPFCG